MAGVVLTLIDSKYFSPEIFNERVNRKLPCFLEMTLLLSQSDCCGVSALTSSDTS